MYSSFPSFLPPFLQHSSGSSALNSIKRMHEHVKKSIQPHNERGQFNYPSTDHPSPDDDPRQPPLTTPPDLAPDSHTRRPNSEEWKYHEGAPLYQQEGEGLGHTPNPLASDYHPAGVGVYPGSGDGEFKDEEGGGEEGRWSRGGGEEWRRDGGGSGGGGGGEEEGREDGGRRKESVGGTYDQDLPGQMSRMRLMEPSHYSTPAYPAGAASAGAAGFVSESHSQLSMPHSSSYTMATQGHGPQERGYRRVSEEVPPQLSGETAEVAAMKEKIRQLEAQLAEEKRKQYSGPQPQQPSPVHTAQLYQEARPPRYSGPVQYSSSPVPVRGSSSGTVIGLPCNPGHLCYAIHPFFPFLPSSISYFFSSLPPPPSLPSTSHPTGADVPDSSSTATARLLCPGHAPLCLPVQLEWASEWALLWGACQSPGHITWNRAHHAADWGQAVLCAAGTASASAGQCVRCGLS